MGKVLVKEGADLGFAFMPAGARILEVLKMLAASYPFDIVITSGRDGMHSGPADPHHTGEAFDIRSKGLTPAQKQALVSDLRSRLYGEPRKFYAFLEAPGTANEHIHIQRRNGFKYLISDYLDNA